MIGLRKIAALMSIAAIMATSIPATAMAGGKYGGGHGKGYGHGYSHGGGHGYRGHRGYRGHYGYRGGYGYRRHRGNDWVPFAVLGGLATALIVTSANSNKNNRSYDDSYDNRQYNPPQATKPCHIVHRVEVEGEQRVKKAATMCYDGQNIAYLVEGSEHVIEYLD